MIRLLFLSVACLSTVSAISIESLTDKLLNDNGTEPGYETQYKCKNSLHPTFGVVQNAPESCSGLACYKFVGKFSGEEGTMQGCIRAFVDTTCKGFLNGCRATESSSFLPGGHGYECCCQGNNCNEQMILETPVKKS